jgi:hypothetical protein
LNHTKQAALILSFAGALLDIYSGYSFLAQSTTTSNDMGVIMTVHNSSAFAWGTGVLALGAILIITAIASVTYLGKTRMLLFGILMIVYGAVMLLIGASMYSGIAPLMNAALLSSAGMFAVGALMILNGALMSRTRVRM